MYFLVLGVASLDCAVTTHHSDGENTVKAMGVAAGRENAKIRVKSMDVENAVESENAVGRSAAAGKTTKRGFCGVEKPKDDEKTLYGIQASV